MSSYKVVLSNVYRLTKNSVAGKISTRMMQKQNKISSELNGYSLKPKRIHIECHQRGDERLISDATFEKPLTILKKRILAPREEED